MKKLLSFAMLCTYLLLNVPLQLNAYSPAVTGYTSEGIFYEAITVTENSTFAIMPIADTVTLTKEFTYSGIITPKNSISWEETIGGTTYSGILYLQSFYYSNNKTIATYKGTLTAE